MSNSSNLDNSVNSSLIRSHQVSPLPVGSGGNNPTKKLLNDTNVRLSMMTAQAAANTKYDPPVPKPITTQVIKEKFTQNSFPSMLYVIGGLFIVYGLVAK